MADVVDKARSSDETLKLQANEAVERWARSLGVRRRRFWVEDEAEVRDAVAGGSLAGWSGVCGRGEVDDDAAFRGAGDRRTARR